MSRWSVDPADVVLGDVPPERQEEAERLIRAEPAFRREVERLRAAAEVVRMSPTTSDASPPPLDLAAALAVRPARASAVPPREQRIPRRRGRPAGFTFTLRPAQAVLATGLLVAAGVALGVGFIGSPASSPPRRAQEASRPASGPALRTVSLEAIGVPGRRHAEARLPVRADGAVQVRVSGARPSRSGEYYELWLLDSRTHLTSVGTFRVGPSGEADVRFALGVAPDRYRFLDVSVERDDGNPGHSGRSVMRSGPLS